MKPLFWKEWREHRLMIPLGAAAMLVVFLALASTAKSMAQTDASWHVYSSDLETTGVLICFVSALLCGVTLVSPEIDAATLQFLSALPLSRRTIWLTKVSVALGILLLSVLSVVCLLSLLSHTGHFFGIIAVSHSEGWGSLLRQPDAPPFILSVLSLFAVASVITVQISRPITALILSTLASIAGYVFYLGVQNVVWIASLSPRVSTWLFLLCPALCLTCSYRLFVYRKLLPAPKRLRIPFAPIADFILVVAAVVLGYLWIVL